MIMPVVICRQMNLFVIIRSNMVTIVVISLSVKRAELENLHSLIDLVKGFSQQVKLSELLIQKQKLLDTIKQSLLCILVRLVELNPQVKIIMQSHSMLMLN